MTFQNRLKHFQKKHSLTNEEMGKFLGISSASVSTWANGKTKPSEANRLIALEGMRSFVKIKQYPTNVNSVENIPVETVAPKPELPKVFVRQEVRVRSLIELLNHVQAVGPSIIECEGQLYQVSRLEK